ncbi:MAG: HAD-IA family hydrolase [Pseudomonadota bacterium]
MSPTVLFFGAIGTLAETSDLQRRAYNRAFAEADLDWIWDAASYRWMLQQPGGKARLRSYAEAAGDKIDVDTLHQAKMRHFAHLVLHGGIELREGVADVMSATQRQGIRLGFATSTAREQSDLILTGLAPDLAPYMFQWIGDRSMVARGKPAPDIYEAGLKALDVSPSMALAIEDTPESAEAALAAGLSVIGFPGVAAQGRSFPPGVPVVDRLSPDLLDMLPRQAHAAE